MAKASSILQHPLQYPRRTSLLAKQRNSVHFSGCACLIPLPCRSCNLVSYRQNEIGQDEMNRRLTRAPGITNKFNEASSSAVEEQRTQYPIQHPQSPKSQGFCARPLPCKDGGLFGLFKTSAFNGTDLRNAVQIEVNERIGLYAPTEPSVCIVTPTGDEKDDLANCRTSHSRIAGDEPAITTAIVTEPAQS